MASAGVASVCSRDSLQEDSLGADSVGSTFCKELLEWETGRRADDVDTGGGGGGGGVPDEMPPESNCCFKYSVRCS